MSTAWWHLPTQPWRLHWGDQLPPTNYLHPRIGHAISWLRQQNLPKQARIGVCSGNSANLAALLIAAPFCEISLVLINHRLSQAEQTRRCQQAACTHVIAEWAIPTCVRLILPASHCWRGPATLPRPNWHGDPEGIVWSLFTSGSTGDPVQIDLSLRAILHAAARQAQALELKPERTWLTCLGLDHIGGAMTLWRSLISGSPIRLLSTFNETSVIESLPRIWGMSLVPTMLHRLLHQHPVLWPDSIGCLFIGGAHCPSSLLATCKKAGLPVRRSYGLSEAASSVCISGLWADHLGSPLPDMLLRIVDDQGTAVPAGQAGLIEISGPQLCSARAKQVIPTASWLATGDYGQLDADGQLTVLDRRSDRIVCAGENLSPQAITDILLEHPQIEDAAVCGLADVEYGAIPVAALQSRNGQAISDFAQWLDAKLPGLQRPRQIRWLPDLPKTVRGKIDRPALLRLFTSDG